MINYERQRKRTEGSSRHNSSAAHTKRPDIQGLRTVAILAVFFFHMWPQQFPNGYLGVDVFFVISGYLIAMILLPSPEGRAKTPAMCVSKEGHVYTQLTSQLDEEENKEREEWEADHTLASAQPLSPTAQSIVRLIVAALHITAHFYRRRVQRIMPAYLMTILVTLLVGHVMLIPDLDLAVLKWDAAWALALAYNMEGLMGRNRVMQNYDYFEEVKSPHFLTHTWSLGVELQFYAVAPLLLGVGRIVSTAASCYAQLWSPAPVAFGAMPCRLWQFFAGVLSFSLSSPNASLKLLKRLNHPLSSTQLEPSRWRQAVGALANYAVLGGLVALLGSPLHHPRLAFVRQAAVVLLTALLLHRHAHIRALTNRASVELGDLSYLVYLVHWPLLQFLRYRYGTWNVGGVLVGVSLLFVCVAAAYVFDRLLDSPLRRITCIYWLLLFLLACYVSCLAMMVPLPGIICMANGRIIPTLRLDGQLVDVNEYGPRFLALVDNGTIEPGELPLGEKAMINSLFWETSTYQYHLVGKDVSIAELHLISSTNGSIWPRWPYRVVRKGEGRHSMLLVGNSHASQIAQEIVALWRPLYSMVHFFTVEACTPFEIEQLDPWVDRRDICHEYWQAVAALMRHLQPDVIFINSVLARKLHSQLHSSGGKRAILYGWFPYGIDNLSNDVAAQKIRVWLEETLSHTRLLIFGLPNLSFPSIEGTRLCREIARRVWFRLPLDDLDLSLKTHLEHTSVSRERVEYATQEIADCDYHREGTTGRGFGIWGLERPTRCLFVDWAEAFCDEQMCRAYDADTQLAYFYDSNHYSWLGSRKVWSLLQRLGDEIATILG